MSVESLHSCISVLKDLEGWVDEDGDDACFCEFGFDGRVDDDGDDLCFCDFFLACSGIEDEDDDDFCDIDDFVEVFGTFRRCLC